MKKKIIIVLTLGLLLSACSKNDAESPPPPSSMQSSEDTTKESSEETIETITVETIKENKAVSETTKAAQAESKGEASMINPMRKVSSSEDFKEIELSLNIYEDENWVEVESYYTIGGEVAEINFHDKLTDSDAYVRAAKAELGDISGLYYKFEDEEAKWLAKTPSGEEIDITLKFLVDGSDIHGALATWTYQGTNYFLWEDNGKKQPDTVGKLAVELAKLNAQ